MIDYHIHSRLCRHGEGEIYEYVEAAIKKGMTEIGFSEHIPIPGLDDPTGRMVFDDWDVYVRDIRDAQKKYPEITIRIGLEADYLPPFMEYIEKFIGDYPFDFVIGSVHFVNDWDFSNPAHRHRLQEFGLDYLHTRYYELLAEAAACGLYDIIGHFDLPKRVGPVPMSLVSDKINTALRSVKESSLALDVNTSGLRKGLKEIYPGKEILRRAAALHIPVVLGSDAHKPSDVAADFAETIEGLKKIGYTHQCIYKNRKCRMIEI